MFSLLFVDGRDEWRRSFPSVNAAIDEARRYLPPFCDYRVYESAENGRYRVVCSILPANFPFGRFFDPPF